VYGGGLKGADKIDVRTDRDIDFVVYAMNGTNITGLVRLGDKFQMI
jgi:hypothetical protein